MKIKPKKEKNYYTKKNRKKEIFGLNIKF